MILWKSDMVARVLLWPLKYVWTGRGRGVDVVNFAFLMSRAIQVHCTACKHDIACQFIKKANLYYCRSTHHAIYCHHLPSYVSPPLTTPVWKVYWAVQATLGGVRKIYFQPGLTLSTPKKGRDCAEKTLKLCFMNTPKTWVGKQYHSQFWVKCRRLF